MRGTCTLSPPWGWERAAATSRQSAFLRQCAHSIPAHEKWNTDADATQTTRHTTAEHSGVVCCSAQHATRHPRVPVCVSRSRVPFWLKPCLFSAFRECEKVVFFTPRSSSARRYVGLSTRSSTLSPSSSQDRSSCTRYVLMFFFLTSFLMLMRRCPSGMWVSDAALGTTTSSWMGASRWILVTGTCAKLGDTGNPHRCNVDGSASMNYPDLAAMTALTCVHEPFGLWRLCHHRSFPSSSYFSSRAQNIGVSTLLTDVFLLAR